MCVCVRVTRFTTVHRYLSDYFCASFAHCRCLCHSVVCVLRYSTKCTCSLMWLLIRWMMSQNLAMKASDAQKNYSKLRGIFFFGRRVFNYQWKSLSATAAESQVTAESKSGQSQVTLNPANDNYFEPQRLNGNSIE